ncbi:MAG TPA: alpha/beta fold hydrolase [Aquabacterium sp.]|nr:alpha/beta fold hydrolase [Aquabacterium sp.]
MSEYVVTFGPQQGLVGTLSIPTEVAPQPLAFVLLNAGVIPRMGPHRFNVKLARSLAQLGISSLRLDLSGQGDSQPAIGHLHHEQQAQADLRAAMDEVTATTGITRFVIAGICSGAATGFAVARKDPRVVGLWMLDGHAYATMRSTLWRIARQLRYQCSETLRTWLTRRLDRLRPKPAIESAPPLDYGVRSPSRTEFAQALQNLVDRGVRVYLVYTLDKLWSYSYGRQFQDMFKGRAFVNEVICEHRPDLDHTLTKLSAQREVIQQIAAWARQIPLAG